VLAFYLREHDRRCTAEARSSKSPRNEVLLHTKSRRPWNAAAKFQLISKRFWLTNRICCNSLKTNGRNIYNRFWNCALRLLVLKVPMSKRKKPGPPRRTGPCCTGRTYFPQ